MDPADNEEADYVIDGKAAGIASITNTKAPDEAERTALQPTS
jgi:hypothetical protein